MTPLRAWRHRIGLSRVALAERMGATSRSVRRWEDGTRQPDPWLWLALAAIEAGAPVPPEAPRTRAEGDQAPE